MKLVSSLMIRSWQRTTRVVDTPRNRWRCVFHFICVCSFCAPHVGRRFLAGRPPCVSKRRCVSLGQFETGYVWIYHCMDSSLSSEQLALQVQQMLDLGLKIINLQPRGTRITGAALDLVPLTRNSITCLSIRVTHVVRVAVLVAHGCHRTTSHAHGQSRPKEFFRRSPK